MLSEIRNSRLRKAPKKVLKSGRLPKAPTPKQLIKAEPVIKSEPAPITFKSDQDIDGPSGIPQLITHPGQHLNNPQYPIRLLLHLVQHDDGCSKLIS